MQRQNLFKFVIYIHLQVIFLVGCQSKQIYVNPQLGLTISYPISWKVVEQSKGIIGLRTQNGEASILVEELKTQSPSLDLITIMGNQLNLIAQDGADPGMGIELGEIKERRHEQFTIVTGNVAAYPKIKFGPSDFPVYVYAATIQFEDRVIFVSASGTGRVSLEAAIEEIINGLEFH